MDNCVRCGLLEGIGLQSTVNPPLPSLHTQNKTWPKFSLTVLDMFNHGRLLHDANKVGIYKELLEDINGMPTSLCFFLHNTWLTCLAVQPRWMYLRYKKTPKKTCTLTYCKWIQKILWALILYEMCEISIKSTVLD